MPGRDEDYEAWRRRPFTKVAGEWIGMIVVGVVFVAFALAIAIKIVQWAL